MKLNILYEDPQLLVCIKPAGTPTQSSRIRIPDMVSILKNHLYKSSPQKKYPYLAVIHRLDQPVEGLLVFAKTPDAAKNLSSQLQASGFHKQYIAILSSIPDKMEDNLVHYMIKDGRTNTSRICTQDTPDAKEARLHYRILTAYGHLAAAEITLDTGRHHQIRVQMAAIGCPIEGDQKYGISDAACRPGAQLKLSARKLSFFHPTSGKRMEFSYTPEFYKNFIKP
ncbi:MAG: RluA family pseudouridine synthase [Schaedlerella sp.]|nr:RluA family pseudouridine synthase [Lachnospiraceae bacterium]MDY4203423.1 RluA family pseudouridine synthase [Schaedlerella sp.]